MSVTENIPLSLSFIFHGDIRGRVIRYRSDAPRGIVFEPFSWFAVTSWRPCWCTGTPIFFPLGVNFHFNANYVNTFSFRRPSRHDIISVNVTTFHPKHVYYKKCRNVHNSFVLYTNMAAIQTTYRLRMMYYSTSDTGLLGKKSECSYQESNLRPSDY